jgi:hypothetical protein
MNKANGQLGEKYRVLRNAHDRLKRIHDSTNQGVVTQARMNAELLQENRLLREKVASLAKACQDKDQIIRNSLDQHRSEKAELVERVQELLAERRKLKKERARGHLD